MNIQGVVAPDGTPLWISGSLPGSVHDLKAARIRDLIRHLETAWLLTRADKGYVGANQRVLVPYKGHNKPTSQKAANSAHARLRSPGERANAQPKTWRILRPAAALFSQVSLSKPSSSSSGKKTGGKTLIERRQVS